MNTADVIIIGGGIIGCALFYELAKNSVNKIILLERDEVASGTSGESGGFIRKLNLDPYLSQLSAESFDYYLNFTKEVGESCDFMQTGLTYTIPNHMLALIQSNIGNLMDENYPIEVRASTDASLIYEYNAGYINTTLTCKNWVKAALKNKAIVYEHCPALNLLYSGGKVNGVETPQGVIEAQTIIVATGFYSAAFSPLLDLNSLISIKSFQYHLYLKASQYIDHAYINHFEGWYLFPQKTGHLLAGYINRDKESLTEKHNKHLDESEASSLHKLLCKHFPWIINKPYTIKRSYDAYTADEQGLMHKSSIKGLFYATGLSGGGIKIAPAFAKRVIELLDS
ncbi:Glycine oxidase [Legionella beliardensis]|uniref:Glycine oxidase n=1 Tax=Legionella beliardensis TaxID=91822 RepID=A0A378HYC7_9GAMM|nr:FAD-dependent oxidoreductase [Legionella beliardensis]STX27898.1 Glycine oxidase [Legionella beliardensis]